MTPLAPWSIESRHHVLSTRVFDLETVEARREGSEQVHRFHRLLAPDWVNVVPLTEQNEVVLVRQLRHGTGQVTLEIPGGMIDPGETPDQAARRELREETGYSADRWHALGFVDPNPALFDNQCHTFAAVGAQCVGEIQNEGAEQTEVVLVPLADIPERIRGGEIRHALVIAAFHWLTIAGDVGGPPA